MYLPDNLDLLAWSRDSLDFSKDNCIVLCIRIALTASFEDESSQSFTNTLLLFPWQKEF